MNNAHRLAVALTLAAILAGCDDAPPEIVERVRAIKPYYVVEPAGGEVRRYSGTIAAANTSALSFAVAGTVRAVEVNQGDRVVEGQLLAALDPEPFELDVQAADSQVATTRARFEKSRVDLDRQQQLYERGWVAQAALDQAVASFDAAQGELSLARSRLGIAERHLKRASLTAPFDGIIALRNVEPFVEVAKGQRILQIDSEEALAITKNVVVECAEKLSDKEGGEPALPQQRKLIRIRHRATIAISLRKGTDLMRPSAWAPASHRHTARELMQ